MESTHSVPYNPAVDDIKKDLIAFCVNPQQKGDILRHIGVEVKSSCFKKYITRMVTNRYIQPVITRNLRSPQQQYTATTKGLNYLRSLE